MLQNLGGPHGNTVHSKRKKFSQPGDFPRGPLGKILSAGDTGSIPGQGTKIPHALHGAAKK